MCSRSGALAAAFRTPIISDHGVVLTEFDDGGFPPSRCKISFAEPAVPVAIPADGPEAQPAAALEHVTSLLIIHGDEHRTKCVDRWRRRVSMLLHGSRGLLIMRSDVGPGYRTCSSLSQEARSTVGAMRWISNCRQEPHGYCVEPAKSLRFLALRRMLC